MIFPLRYPAFYLLLEAETRLPAIVVWVLAGGIARVIAMARIVAGTVAGWAVVVAG
jgi:hypothetical protein